MLTLTDSAKALLESCLGAEERRPIRVYAVPGGCRGPMLVIALDEADAEFDEVVEAGGFTFCMAKELAALAGGVTLDAAEGGFTCVPERPLPGSGGCASCGSGCASSGCAGCG